MESGLQCLPEVWGAALKVSMGTPLSPRCLRWVLLVGHSLSNSVCSFHLQLSAALNVNYRGTLQLDISPFTLYLKQHAATSKSCGCFWCCKKKELQWSTKNQCNFLEPCFIHLLSAEVGSQSLEVQRGDLKFGKVELCPLKNELNEWVLKREQCTPPFILLQQGKGGVISYKVENDCYWVSGLKCK